MVTMPVAMPVAMTMAMAMAVAVAVVVSVVMITIWTLDCPRGGNRTVLILARYRHVCTGDGTLYSRLCVAITS